MEWGWGASRIWCFDYLWIFGMKEYFNRLIEPYNVHTITGSVAGTMSGMSFLAFTGSFFGVIYAVVIGGMVTVLFAITEIRLNRAWFRITAEKAFIAGLSVIPATAFGGLLMVAFDTISEAMCWVTLVVSINMPIGIRILMERNHQNATYREIDQ